MKNSGYVTALKHQLNLWEGREKEGTVIRWREKRNERLSSIPARGRRRAKLVS